MDIILVHGGCHSGSCWSVLRTELERRGHSTWAPDLPIEDVTNGSSAYASNVIEACRDAGQDAVIVGHSLGGLTIPLVASRRRVARMVFLCAAVPVPGQSYREQREVGDGMPPMMADITYDDAGRIYFTEEAARTCFYHDCPPALVDEAVRNLRPNGTLQLSELTPLEHWPDIPATFIYCRDDRCMPSAYGQRIAEEQFGSDVTLLDGGHSPFLARPKELADHIVGIVAARGVADLRAD